jgi:hypothetical protein
MNNRGNVAVKLLNLKIRIPPCGVILDVPNIWIYEMVGPC